MNNRYTDLCTGCGLCHSVNNTEMIGDAKGFLFPINMKAHEVSFCDTVCPMGVNGIKPSNGIWGNYKVVYRGWSANDQIRTIGSSGGVLTSLSIYMLDKKLVDGVILTRKSRKNIEGTDIVICSNKEDVLQCIGSRYTQSNPLYNILNIIDRNKTYAFIGKPCDVTALRNYVRLVDRSLEGCFVYYLSFFCAGTPSVIAHEKLYESLSCNRKEIETIDYRGHGWPGRITLYLKEKDSVSVSYEEGWMKYLGRDIRYPCKFCYDGIGESADISAGDLWNLDNNNKPIFEESDGVNVIFGRTSEGAKLLSNAIRDRYIVIEKYDEISTLRYCQPNHFAKRTTCLDKILALRLAHRSIPGFKIAILRQKRKELSQIEHLKAFAGTIKRIIKKRI